MFDQIVQALVDFPYLGVALLFLLCGLGLPLPEELVLLAAGYICGRQQAVLHWMMLWCAGAILLGDLLPFVLGRVFGARLLRLRWMRLLINKQRLAMFDRWFRRRGDLVILIARFLAGIRVVAFFTAGTMKMSWTRFLLLDGLGITLIVPLLTYLGFQSTGFIDDLVAKIQSFERGLQWAILATAIALVVWFWLWRRRRQRLRSKAPRETFVAPQRRVESSLAATRAPDATGTTAPAPDLGATSPPGPTGGPRPTGADGSDPPAR